MITDCNHASSPNGLGVVSWQHCAQHCGLTLQVPRSKRLEDVGDAWSSKYRDGHERFPPAQVADNTTESCTLRML